MIDPEKEELIDMRTAATLIPGKSKNGKANLATAYRAVWPGVFGVCLDSISTGGRQYTSRAAITRFFAQVTKARRAQREAKAAARRGERLKAQEQADAAKQASEDVAAMLGPGKKRGRPRQPRAESAAP